MNRERSKSDIQRRMQEHGPTNQGSSLANETNSYKTPILYSYLTADKTLKIMEALITEKIRSQI